MNFLRLISRQTLLNFVVLFLYKLQFQQRFHSHVSAALTPCRVMGGFSFDSFSFLRESVTLPGGWGGVEGAGVGHDVSPDRTQRLFPVEGSTGLPASMAD